MDPKRQLAPFERAPPATDQPTERARAIFPGAFVCLDNRRTDVLVYGHAHAQPRQRSKPRRAYGSSRAQGTGLRVNGNSSRAESRHLPCHAHASASRAHVVACDNIARSRGSPIAHPRTSASGPSTKQAGQGGGQTTDHTHDNRTHNTQHTHTTHTRSCLVERFGVWLFGYEIVWVFVCVFGWLPPSVPLTK